MRYLLYAVLVLLALILLLLAVAVVRTLLMPKKVAAYEPQPDPRAQGYAAKLADMIRCETVSSPDDPQIEKFLGFHKVLESLFPLVHEKLEKPELDGNLLFYWKGEKHDKPVVLMSHQDVVPAEGVWEHEPFSGDIADGKVWGRGTADTKASVMAFFQACCQIGSQGLIAQQHFKAHGFPPSSAYYITVFWFCKPFIPTERTAWE